MQSKETLKRLTNPPIKDGRKKPIDLGDMPEDMDLELTKVALYDIIEEILEKYKDGNLETNLLGCDSTGIPYLSVRLGSFFLSSWNTCLRLSAYGL